MEHFKTKVQFLLFNVNFVQQVMRLKVELSHVVNVLFKLVGYLNFKIKQQQLQ